MLISSLCQRLTKSDYDKPLNLGSDEMVSMNEMMAVSLGHAFVMDLYSWFLRSSPRWQAKRLVSNTFLDQRFTVWRLFLAMIIFESAGSI